MSVPCDWDSGCIWAEGSDGGTGSGFGLGAGAGTGTALASTPSQPTTVASAGDQLPVRQHSPWLLRTTMPLESVR